MKTNKKQQSIATALVLSMVGFASTAHAGRIALTGHDDDFHQSAQAQRDRAHDAACHHEPVFVACAYTSPNRWDEKAGLLNGMHLRSQ